MCTSYEIFGDRVFIDCLMVLVPLEMMVSCLLIFEEVQRQDSCRTRKTSQRVNTEFQEALSLMAGASSSFRIAS